MISTYIDKGSVKSFARHIVLARLKAQNDVAPHALEYRWNSAGIYISVGALQLGCIWDFSLKTFIWQSEVHLAQFQTVSDAQARQTAQEQGGRTQHQIHLAC